MMRKRIKDQAKACDHYTHTLRKEDRDVNRKRKMQWKQENKEESLLESTNQYLIKLQK